MTTNFFHPSLLLLFWIQDPGWLKIRIQDLGKRSRILNSGISCLDSSLGIVPACDAGDPGSIPGRDNLNVCLQLGSRVIINIMHLFLHPPHPTTGAHNLLEI
jgi:hypothetical protein